MQQPPQYPYHQPDPIPTPPRPGRIARFRSWYREQPRYMQIVVGIIIAGCVVFVVSAAISGVVQGIQNPIVVATPQATVATKTAKPTPAPTKALTQAQQVAQLITSNATNGKVDVTDNDGKTINAIITLNSAPDNLTYQTWIKQNCFAILKAEWTAKIPGLKDVNLAFRGVDFPGPVGRCELTSASAAKTPWAALDPDSAWIAAYDVAMFYTDIQ
jgi:hypothetical protein